MSEIAARVRHVPQRTCVGCRQVRARSELLRVVRTVEGAVQVDPMGTVSGRGAYVCRRVECVQRAAKGRSLERALGALVDSGVVAELRGCIEPERRPEGSAPSKAVLLDSPEWARTRAG